MTYAEHLSLMTRALVDVARHGQHQLTEPEVDVALFARRAVLDLLAGVHADLTGLRRTSGVPRIDDLEAHPVAALDRALARHPRAPVDLAPTEALSTPVTTPTGRAWREAGRQALLAEHHWQAGRTVRLDPPTRWAGVADVAALAGQLAALDVELADVLARRSPPGAVAPSAAVAQLNRAATAGLGVTAREVVRLARAGPVAQSGPDADAEVAVPRRIVVVRSVTDLVAAQERLAQWLDAATHVRPERLPLLAVSIARGALVVRDQLPAGDPAATALRGELREHARLLREVTARPGGLFSLDVGDLRPLRQAAEIHQGASRFGGQLAGSPTLLGSYIEALAASTQALSGAVDRSIATRRWLVPDPTAPRYAPQWAPLRRVGVTPRPVLALTAAAGHAAQLRAVVRAWSAPSAPVQVRAVLERAAGRSPSGPAPREVTPSLDAIRRPRLPSHRAGPRPLTIRH